MTIYFTLNTKEAYVTSSEESSQEATVTLTQASSEESSQEAIITLTPSSEESSQEAAITWTQASSEESSGEAAITLTPGCLAEPELNHHGPAQDSDQQTQ